MNQKWWAITLLAWIYGGSCCVADAQPASEEQALFKQLAAEGATSLARAAREKGSAIRGAILFPQKKLSCANCHSPGARDLGPDLTQIGKDVPDEYFVESILYPSKVITKGYESVKLLTESGKIAVGRIVTDDDNQLVLRDPTDAKKLIRFDRNEIEEISPNEKSTMPDGLADQLDDRQQFLDLVKYLMDIAATSKPSVTPRKTPVSGEVDPRIRGLALLDHFGCQSCHDSDAADVFPEKRAPNLKSSTARIDPHYIRRFITDPQTVKAGSSMPNVMDMLGEREKRTAADAITQYLLSLTEQPFQWKKPEDAAAMRGEDLFHTIGCVACHPPRGGDGRETLVHASVPLGSLHDKYSLNGLAAFLEDPHSLRPSGRMPNMTLTHWQAIDIASHLLSGAGDRSTPMPKDPSQVMAGKRYFSKLGCADCHELDDSIQSSYTSLAKLNPQRGCLSSKPGPWPRYRFDDAQRDALRIAIQQLSDELTDQEKITLTMQTFRCFACHERSGLGGVSADRDVYFHTANQNLGPQGRIPPTLSGVGAKLEPKWLREVLVSGRAIRPYIKTRMPQYGAENVKHLVDLFPQVDELADITFGHFDDEQEAKKVGTELVGSGGLNCIACHTFQLKPAQTMSAVDLTEMAQRLRKKWFYHYLQTPQQLSPQTVMPSFWPGGHAIRKDILSGDMNQQIEAIWFYLQEGRQARTPRGLNQKPIELLATDRAVMLRRSYQSIGKRGIGVGYPGGVNLAYDAEQLRIGMIWKGRFADPGGVWRGQGSGTVRPLGSDIIRFVPGPELDDAQSPWVVDEGRPPKHQFTGYFLDECDRPTFTYRFEQIEVEDYPIDFSEAPGEAMLRRTLTFTTDQPRKNLAFRAASHESITSEREGVFRVGESMRIRIVDNHRVRIVAASAGKQLVIPLDLPAGRSQLVIQYTW